MIECIKYKAVNKGALCGFADLYVSDFDLEIFGCGVFQKDNRIWVTFPSKEIIDQDGLKRYYSHVKFRDKSRMEAFIHEAMKAIRPKMENPSSGHPPWLGSPPF